jgi:hypothetical protein
LIQALFQPGITGGKPDSLMSLGQKVEQDPFRPPLDLTVLLPAALVLARQECDRAKPGISFKISQNPIDVLI